MQYIGEMCSEKVHIASMALNNQLTSHPLFRTTSISKCDLPRRTLIEPLSEQPRRTPVTLVNRNSKRMASEELRLLSMCCQTIQTGRIPM